MLMALNNMQSRKRKKYFRRTEKMTLFWLQFQEFEEFWLVWKNGLTRLDKEWGLLQGPLEDSSRDFDQHGLFFYCHFKNKSFRFWYLYTAWWKIWPNLLTLKHWSLVSKIWLTEGFSWLMISKYDKLYGW